MCLFTCRVIAAVLQPLQTFEQDLEDLTASARDVIVEVRKYSYGERENVVLIDGSELKG